MFKLCRLILIAFVALCVYCAVLLGEIFGGAMVALVVIGGIAWATKRRRVLTSFGTAKWAEEKDLAGMLGVGSGLVVGRLLDSRRPQILAGVLGLINPRVNSADACNGFLRAIFRKVEGTSPLVRLSRAVHICAFSPTGGGKGVSLAIPFLRSCKDSCVSVDFKSENYGLTADLRRAMGQRVVALAPFGVGTQLSAGDCFNPLDFIDRNSPNWIDEVRDLAEAQVIRTGTEHEPHWNDSAEFLIAACTAAVVQYGDRDDRSLQTVRGLVSDPQKLEMVGKLLRDSKDCDGMLARMGHQLLYFQGKELASTLTTVNRHLRYLDTPAIAANTRRSTFDTAELLTGKLSVYLILPPEHARAQSPLLRMWISSMLRACVRGGLQERNKVHFVLDEAATLGHMEQLDDALDKYRGYGVRLNFFYQSLGQLKKCWPDGQDQTFLSNVTQVFFGTCDLSTGEYVANRCGEQTICVDSGGVSRGTSRQHSDRDGNGSFSSSFNSNDNWQQQARKLLKPEEVLALSPRTAITFAPGVPPICTRLIRYYEERPDSLWQRTTRGFKAVVYALALLGVPPLSPPRTWRSATSTE